MAREVLKTKDHNFASRPRNLVHNNKDLINSPYGEYWRRLRALCVQELLSSRVIASFQRSRKEEVCNLLRLFFEDSVQGQPSQVRQLVSQYTYNTLTHMMVGRKFLGSKNSVESEQFKITKKLLETTVVQFAQFHISDYIPLLRWLDRGPADLRHTVQFIWKFWTKLIQQKKENPSNDFLSSLLSYRKDVPEQEQEEDAKHASLAILSAGTDAVSTTIEWALAELLDHPKILEKLREEIDSVVGSDRLVEESDLEKLEYLQAVINETLRLHAPVPLTIVHMSMEDDYIAEYFVPKGTRIYVNLFAIGRDPKTWNNPEKFLPERFINSDKKVEPLGHDFELLPFGSGRRSCPGLGLALISVPLVLANLVHVFNWKLASDPHCLETYGIAAPMEVPLKAIPSPRLTNLDNMLHVDV